MKTNSIEIFDKEKLVQKIIRVKLIRVAFQQPLCIARLRPILTPVVSASSKRSRNVRIATEIYRVRFCSRTIVSISAVRGAMHYSIRPRVDRGYFVRNMHANERSWNSLSSPLVGSLLLCGIECISYSVHSRVTEVKAFVVLPLFCRTDWNICVFIECFLSNFLSRL